MQNRKVFKILIPSLTIFFILGFVLSEFISNDNYNDIYWISLLFLICGIFLDIYYWSKVGLDIDKKESKMIKRLFDDNTALLGVSYGTLLCIILFFNNLNHNVMKNNYVIIGMFIMTLEFELFTYLSIGNAKEDTAKLLKGSK
jgi:hypothetical protein